MESPVTQHIGGIHRVTLLSEEKREDFERFMTEGAFPIAAETPGSVNRGGQSSIKSQHLLRSEGTPGEYLWFVKASGVFGLESFTRVFNRMYDEVREKMEAYAIHESSIIFVVVDSLEVGPRDHSGRPIGSPKRGSDI